MDYCAAEDALVAEVPKLWDVFFGTDLPLRVFIVVELIYYNKYFDATLRRPIFLGKD